MNSSNASSTSQTDSDVKINFRDIVKKLGDLDKLLTKAKDDAETKFKADASSEAKSEGKLKAPVQADKSQTGDNKVDTELDEVFKEEKELKAQLEKVCKEINYMIRELQKLGNFENDLNKLLETITRNVTDIQKDLSRYSSRSTKQLEHNLHNLKVLRSNLTKVKLQIPLQHQASNLISDASRYLQATVPSREASDLPDLYEAVNKFDGDSFLKGIMDKYDGLGDEDITLKLCLLCFAIFPESAEIKKSLLRFWWIGERLTERPPSGLPSSGGPGVSEENDDADRVNKVLDVLVKAGFIDPVNKKSKLPATSYKMHPVARAKLIRFAKEAGFFDYDVKGNPTMDSSLVHVHTKMHIPANKKTCLVKSHQKNVEDQSHIQQQNSKEKLPKDDQLAKLEKKQQIHLSKLQTVFNISKQFPDFPADLFSKMKGLGVLHLGKWESTTERHMEVESTEFLEKGLVNMKKLRLFSLQGISGITKLPDSLCKVSNLRILDLRALHNLEELPKDIGLLKKLAYLDISECYLIEYMPKQLRLLSELRVLKGFVISKDKRSCRLDRLTELSKLIKLTINVNSSEFLIDDVEDILSKFKSLEKLRIAWGAGGEASSPSSEERNVETKSNSRNEGNGNHHDKKSVFPMAFSKLKLSCGESSSAKDNGKQGDNKSPEVKALNLVKLDLQCFPRQKQPSWLVPEKLTNLKSLYIRGGSFSGPIPDPVGNKEGKDKVEWKVEQLRLKYLAQIKTSWNELRTQFPKLKYLERVRCPGITLCPCDANGVWLKHNSSEN